MTLTQNITMVEMTEEQIGFAEKVAKRLGYEQTAYTSTSALWGLFCLPDHAKHRHGCLVQTVELGLLWIADLEDLQLHDFALEQQNARRIERQVAK